MLDLQINLAVRHPTRLVIILQKDSEIFEKKTQHARILEGYREPSV